MANGIEGRTPFSIPVADFALRLPDDLKATTKTSKRILRDWLAINAAAQPYARKTDSIRPSANGSRRGSEIEQLVAAQPGVEEAFTRDDVARVFSDPARNHQPAWSLLFYALWHTCHVLGISSSGDIQEVLEAARVSA